MGPSRHGACSFATCRILRLCEGYSQSSMSHYFRKRSNGRSIRNVRVGILVFSVRVQGRKHHNRGRNQSRVPTRGKATSHKANAVEIYSLEEGVGLNLSRIFGIGVVEQVLNAQHDLMVGHSHELNRLIGSYTWQRQTHLFDGDGWLPRLLLVQDRETDGAGGVDIGMVQGRDEAA